MADSFVKELSGQLSHAMKKASSGIREMVEDLSFHERDEDGTSRTKSKGSTSTRGLPSGAIAEALAQEVAPTTDVYLLRYPMVGINVNHWKLLFRSQGESKELHYGMFGVRVTNELKFSPKRRPKDESPDSAKPDVPATRVMGVQRSVDVLGSVNESIQDLIKWCREWATEHVYNAKGSSSTSKKLKKPPANCLDLVKDFCKAKEIGADVVGQLVEGVAYTGRS